MRAHDALLVERLPAELELGFDQAKDAAAGREQAGPAGQEQF